MKIIDCIVPLVGCDEDGNPEPIGSGVLVEIGTKIFLITATHVFTHNPKTTIYYPGLEQLETLEGTRYGASPRREDVTFMEFPSALPELGKGYSPIPVEMIEMSDRTCPGDQYTLSGFPEELQKVDIESNAIKSQRFTYTATVQEDRIYKKCSATKATHIAIHFSKRRARTATKHLVKPPSLHCMSGGGVWKATKQPATPDIPSLRLVGISIEKHEKWGAVVATRINFAMEAIRLKHPELSDLIPKSTTLMITANEKQ
jgi:hypothetical protein